MSENRRDQQDGAAIPLVFDDERGKVQRVRVLAAAGAAFESSCVSSRARSTSCRTRSGG